MREKNINLFLSLHHFPMSNSMSILVYASLFSAARVYGWLGGIVPWFGYVCRVTRFEIAAVAKSHLFFFFWNEDLGEKRKKVDSNTPKCTGLCIDFENGNKKILSESMLPFTKLKRFPHRERNKRILYHRPISERKRTTKQSGRRKTWSKRQSEVSPSISFRFVFRVRQLELDRLCACVYNASSKII